MCVQGGEEGVGLECWQGVAASFVVGLSKVAVSTQKNEWIRSVLMT